MKATKSSGLQSLYRIPWESLNNANGWIEPTTHCQLKCPGCYRGLAKDGHVPEHLDMETLKSQVDFMVGKRNVQTISIAGGDPLLYPDLDELISYISDQGVKPVILTNGLLLDEDRLKDLKKMGVGRIFLHLDKFQQREAEQDEVGVNRHRARYCDLFRKVKGVQLGFIMPISLQSMADLDILAPFFIENVDIIQSITFTVYRDSLAANELSREPVDGLEAILDKVKRSFDVNYCAYIPKLYTDDIAWIYASTLYRNGRSWGSLGPETFEKIQTAEYESHGRYQFLPFDRKSEQLLDHGVYSQTILLVNPPELTPRGWNLCKGCPDAMLYQGKLVPSCLLERVKEGEDIRVV